MERPVILMDDRLDALRQGEAVRVPVPELGGEVVMILAAPDESTEQVLEETLQDIREKRAWMDLSRKATIGQKAECVEASPFDPVIFDEVRRRDQEISSGTIVGRLSEEVMAAARKVV